MLEDSLWLARVSTGGFVAISDPIGSFDLKTRALGPSTQNIFPAPSRARACAPSAPILFPITFVVMFGAVSRRSGRLAASSALDGWCRVGCASHMPRQACMIVSGDGRLQGVCSVAPWHEVASAARACPLSCGSPHGVVLSCVSRVDHAIAQPLGSLGASSTLRRCYTPPSARVGERLPQERMLGQPWARIDLELGRLLGVVAPGGPGGRGRPRLLAAAPVPLGLTRFWPLSRTRRWSGLVWACGGGGGVGGT